MNSASPPDDLEIVKRVAAYKIDVILIFKFCEEVWYEIMNVFSEY